MNLEAQVTEAILTELKRQAANKGSGLRVEADDPASVRIEGRVNMEELVMAVIGSVAGGP
jgi:hypothetical protein